MSYLRKAKLTVESANYTLDLSELHFTFATRQDDLQTPNNATIRVFNLSSDTMQRVEKEGVTVSLEAGYQDEGIALLFKGELVQVRRGRESPVDTYLDIACVDGGAGYALATVETTFSAGTSAKQRLDALLAAFDKQGVKAGTVDLPNPDATLPRGKTMQGMARDEMRVLAENQNCRWSIQNGMVTIIRNTGYLGGDPVEMSAATGMIGIPEQTELGVKVRSLINPRLKVGGTIKIKGDVNAYAADVSLRGSVNNTVVPGLNSQGLYRIIVMEHSGDNRGQDWYSDLITVAVDATLPRGLVERGYVDAGS